MRSVQGGVLPKCAQGSRETYKVLWDINSFPATLFRQLTSACSSVLLVPAFADDPVLVNQYRTHHWVMPPARRPVGPVPGDTYRMHVYSLMQDRKDTGS